ncbi:MAG: sigma-70 family RNA polymerase sigma factor [Leptospiraceae bacterium]|nr:sigma-70 family RNA polymerase sigma factor [Leptospiraceae bacterium]MDW8305563.1 sigma-70 family RNA polymerase sigma factor [Leptospiraceae bacterium]
MAIPQNKKEDSTKPQLGLEDEKKFHEVYKKYHLKIYNYIAKNIGNRDDALDLLQEVFLLFYERLPRLDISSEKIEFWLFRVARNLCLTYNRTELRRLSKNLLHPQKATEVGGDEILYRQEMKKRLDEFLDDLNDQERCIFILHKFEGVKYKDLMKIFGMSPRTLKRVVAGILAKMRNNRVLISHNYPNSLFSL